MDPTPTMASKGKVKKKRSKKNISKVAPSSLSQDMSEISVTYSKNFKNSRLLQLPQKVRLEIWKKVHYKHFQDLRLICRQIATDIDHSLGVSAIIDERHYTFPERVESLGIRHATIINLSSSEVSMHLKHPELLRDLAIKGPISSAYFEYFLTTCPNISSFTMNFSKTLISNKPDLFAETKLVLPNLRTLKIISHTKSKKDLSYVFHNVAFLMDDIIDTKKHLVDLHLIISHKNEDDMLEQIVNGAFLLAFYSHSTLQEFHIQVWETYQQKPENGSGDKIGSDSGNRRGSAGTLAEGSDGLELQRSASQVTIAGVPLSNSKRTLPGSSRTTNQNQGSDRRLSRRGSISTTILGAKTTVSGNLKKAEKFLNEHDWPNFPMLVTVVMVLTSELFHQAQSMLVHTQKLKHFKLEISGNDFIPDCSKSLLQIIDTMGNTLTVIRLWNINYQSYNSRGTMDVDFSVFRHCKNLKYLHISLEMEETGKIASAQNVTSLPSSLGDLELYYLTMTAWQWFRLLTKYKRLHWITINYGTPSETSFGRFVCLLQWLIRFNWTKVEHIRITDFKIKFRNKRGAIKALQKAVPVRMEYQDREETMLAIDRGKERSSEHSIPSIESE